VTEGDVTTKLDETIAKNELSPGVFEDEMNWKGAYRLYRKVLRQPALATYSTDFEHFVDDNQNLPTGKLAYIAEEKAELFALSATQDSVLESRRATWRQKTEALRQLDSLRQSGATVNPTTFSTAAQQSADAQGLYQQYMDSLLPARRVKIQTLLTLNSAVATSLTPEVNHQTVNEIVLNLLLNDTLGSGELSVLEYVAGQCPLEGGDAVYEARGIVSYLTGADFDDVAICEEAEEREQQLARQESKISAVALYPNPTTGQVFWSGVGEQVVVLRVFNALGQLQAEQTASGNNADLSRLPNGLYTLKIFSMADNTLLATQKIQIVKN